MSKSDKSLDQRLVENLMRGQRLIERALGIRNPVHPVNPVSFVSTTNSAAAISAEGFVSIDVSTSNAIDARDVPADGWFAFATFGDHPSPDRSYTQIFHREQAEEMVKTWNSIAGKFGRLNKNLRHRTALKFSVPIFENHVDMDPQDWSALKPLGEGTDMRVTANALEIFVKWNGANMRTRGPGPLYPSALWWHEPPDEQRRVFPALLESIALVPTPNIASVPAWTQNASPQTTDNQNQNPMNEEQLKALRKSLSLPEDAPVSKVIETAQSAYQLSTSNATALQTANSAKTELETKLTTANTELTAEKGKVTALTSERDGLNTKVTELSTANGILVDGVLDAFELAGKITPAQRADVKAKFTANIAGSAAVITELKTKKEEVNTKHLEINGDRKDISTANARKIVIDDAVSKLMRDEKIEDYSVAYARVQADPKFAQVFAAMQDPTRAKAA